MREQTLYRAPTYDIEAVQPLRDELVAVGLRSSAPRRTSTGLRRNDGDRVRHDQLGLRLRRGSARPGVALALQHTVIPDRLVTVFAGMEHDAVDRVRALHAGYPPSSPSMVLFKDGTVVAMVERRMIEGSPRSSSPVTLGSLSPATAHDRDRRFPRANSPSSNSPRCVGPPSPAIEPAELGGTSVPDTASGQRGWPTALAEARRAPCVALWSSRGSCC